MQRTAVNPIGGSHQSFDRMPSEEMKLMRSYDPRKTYQQERFGDSIEQERPRYSH